jgi:outer membrane protein
MLAALSAAVLLLWNNTVVAKEAGDWIVRAGATHIAPKSDNGSLDADPTIELDVDSATMFTFDGTYMISNNWAVELLAALPFKHDVSATGLGKVATVKHLPPTLSGQYHFNPAGKFSPYVGAGVNWTIFFDEDPKGALEDVDLKLTNSLGLAAVVGVDIPLTENMLLNATVRWMNIESDVKVNGDKAAKAKIDPWIYAINIGWRF